MRIVIPELESPIIREAITDFPDIDFIGAENLDVAVELLIQNKADSMLSGLDFSSRDVLLAYKNRIPLKSDFFSSCFICQKVDQLFALADGGVNKLPTKDQFYCLIKDTAETFAAFSGETPRIALLSYSTNGSGGKNPDLEKIHYAIEKIRTEFPEWLIDGEMQLDAAIDPAISAKKFPTSQIAGRANVLITPDLNSGNILYKSLERFGGFTVAGPIIQGFDRPLADLSRGSTVSDVKLTLNVIIKLLERS